MSGPTRRGRLASRFGASSVPGVLLSKPERSHPGEIGSQIVGGWKRSVPGRSAAPHKARGMKRDTTPNEPDIDEGFVARHPRHQQRRAPAPRALSRPRSSWTRRSSAGPHGKRPRMEFAGSRGVGRAAVGIIHTGSASVASPRSRGEVDDGSPSSRPRVRAAGALRAELGRGDGRCRSLPMVAAPSGRVRRITHQLEDARNLKVTSANVAGKVGR
jgi:hypothetical protein